MFLHTQSHYLLGHLSTKVILKTFAKTKPTIGEAESSPHKYCADISMCIGDKIK